MIPRILERIRAIPVEHRALVYRVAVALLLADVIARPVTRWVGVDVDTMLNVLAVVLGLPTAGLAAAHTPRREA